MTDRALNIVALPAAPDGSGYYRMFLPFKHLRANSRHLAMLPPPGRVPPPPTAEDMEEVDVFVSQRPVGPLGMKAWDKLRGVTARVYEVDDDLLRTIPSILAHLCEERVRDTIRSMLRDSEMVTVSTPFLAEQVSQYNANVRVLPNFVSADLLDLRHTRGPEGEVTVGWSGGVSHMADWAALGDVTGAVLRRHADVAGMHFVGCDFSPLVHRECRWTKWSDDIWDYYRKVDFDIGLAPLADIPFNYSKSHIRALEYAAMGIPVVATDLPPYRDIVIDGVTGYLCQTPEQFGKRLAELINDPAARDELGANARRHAAAYTIQGNWKLWESAYEEAAGGV